MPWKRCLRLLKVTGATVSVFMEAGKAVEGAKNQGGDEGAAGAVAAAGEGDPQEDGDGAEREAGEARDEVALGAFSC